MEEGRMASTSHSMRSGDKRKRKLTELKDAINETPDKKLDNNGRMADVEDARLEFRSYPDDAWYTVRVLVEGDYSDVLRIKYCNFPDDGDSIFRTAEFKDQDHFKDFASRFRPVSSQLQDSECSLVARGLLVSASHHFKTDDIRFYDAIVEEVDHCEHSFANGEEECLCSFILSWLHGPLAGYITAERLEQICRVHHRDEIDSVVASFLSKVKAKLKTGSCRSNHQVTRGVTHNNHGEPPMMKISHNLSFSHHLKQETKFTKWILSDTLLSKWAIGRPCEKTGQDIDIGGVKNYLIFVDNIDKDLTHIEIMEFIKEKVSVASQAFLFPSLSSDVCTRVCIMLDTQSHFEKLCNFLSNPDHIIVSLSGRPWVMTETMKVNDSLRASILSLSLLSQERKRNNGSRDELKVVHSGSDEYRLAKHLSNLYKDLSNQEKRLQKRLIVES
ncbi:uncharacterized protein LOC115717198 [Cannabis sativa]|uniref:SAWADEE domain-containing protein n=1 Tax=Cannabis sativa TaxID=3483 RepID=A0A7J6DXJ9_CANSA|nr:uncharacterized protein LOC115717198 [Cannabis sativa]XP_060971081.1 uncharacterized protein LOC115717198 [Cannabis sativa]KAF4349677.1 hypothetical protein F8388_019637 [Cannabis sativa]KAF4350360.1 hypothetical protein G4B88_030878 [Cannabis sativa]